MKKYKIGFIGYGNMAKAIAKGLMKIDIVESLSAYDPYYDTYDGIVSVKTSAQNLIDENDYIFLAIKPQMAETALKGLNFDDKTVISIMAGKSTESVCALCSGIKRLVRVMPNLCARIGKSVNAYCSVGLSDESLLIVESLLSSFGKVVRLDEKYFDVITGLTGSSPAYTFRYAKAITECGMRNGLDFEQSRDLALYSVSACMDLLKDTASLEEMQTTIDNVCSKGGTTIEGIYKLDEGNFDELVISAINSAIAKSVELSKK
ncbi:MAG: pyrroline-5-carboxylate reductase [Clostridia bacterium]|nr:pyrroline-5-carboxylate reductase [Clostridia bacterium]